MDSDPPFDLDGSPSAVDYEGYSDIDDHLDPDMFLDLPKPSTSKQTLDHDSVQAQRNGKTKSRIIDLDASEDDNEVQAISLPKPKPKATPHRTERRGEGLTAEEEAQLASLEAEIQSVTDQIASLKIYKSTLLNDRQKLKDKQAKSVGLADGKQHRPQIGKQTNYLTEKFAWSKSLKAKVKDVWNIDSYRSVQEGILNAVLQGRDCVAIMPTGAGKSLTYQAPALLLDGLTVVISPLLSLASDQVWHLREHGVEAVALNSTTSRTDANEVLKRISYGGTSSSKEIKLLYVTPEKIVKSKTLSTALQKAYDGGRLARIAIDEAHCCSSLGHDYRPDYSKLGLLKNLWPETPIIALSATCPPRVLKDILKILKLQATTPGENANSVGTVMFSTPLFRANLHFKVVPRPSQAQEALEALSNWILDNHPGQSGIVYCLSQNDCQKMAQGLRDCSDNQIKSAVYHAGIDDAEKERIHVKWRAGGVKVICATTAFGMGIDKPDVRFVAHATPAKSFEGLYQESGRAGRDGAESDCIVWYRPAQDVARLSSLTMRETDGTSKLLDLLGYLNNREICRKQLFARYFRDQYTTDSDDPCGNCDNCQRSADSTTSVNVNNEVWRIVKMCEAAFVKGGRLSFSQFCDLVRGLGGGTFGTVGGKGGRKGDTKDKIDVADYGGKITLSKDDAELVVAQLLADRVLGFHFTSNAYSDLAYLCPGQYGQKWLRLSRDEAAEQEYMMTLMTKKKAATRKRKSTIGEAGLQEEQPLKKRKSKKATMPDSDEEKAAAEAFEGQEEIEFLRSESTSGRQGKPRVVHSDDDDEGVWDTIL